jgi:hypothetical protein
MYQEIERKLSANQVQFIDMQQEIAKQFGILKPSMHQELVAYYYDNNLEYIRHRVGKDINEITIKRGIDNKIRTEVDLLLTSESTTDDVYIFLALLGYSLNTVLHKNTIHIYTKNLQFSYSKIYDCDFNYLDTFLEIESKCSDLSTERQLEVVDLAVAHLQHIFPSLSIVNQSLFQLYKK